MKHKVKIRDFQRHFFRLYKTGETYIVIKGDEEIGEYKPKNNDQSQRQ